MPKKKLSHSALEPWLQEWYTNKPDVLRDEIAIAGRMIRLEPAYNRLRARILDELGLTPEISEVIITLFRQGPPYERSPSALSVGATISTAAMTYRLNNAEAMGLIERRPDPNDRRGVIVRLTRAGKRLANRDVDMHLELVRNILQSFSASERETLANLLQKLLAALQQ